MSSKLYYIDLFNNVYLEILEILVSEVVFKSNFRMPPVTEMSEFDEVILDAESVRIVRLCGSLGREFVDLERRAGGTDKIICISNM